MPEQFDPYHKWLGIRPEEQPATFYRLLGITPFENDLDTIANAADQRMAHIRSFQMGKNSDLSQRILNELSAAKLCLLNSAKKLAYDEQLRRRRKTSLPVARPLEVAPVPRPPLPKAIAKAVDSNPAPTSRANTVKKNPVRLPLALAAAVIGVPALLGIVAMSMSRSDSTAESKREVAASKPVDASGPPPLVSKPQPVMPMPKQPPKADPQPVPQPEPVRQTWSGTPVIASAPIVRVPQQNNGETVSRAEEQPEQPPVPSVSGPLAVKQNPVPTEAAQAEATKLIKEVYGDEYAKAKTATEKQALAKKLIGKANESKDEAGRPVCSFEAARDIATQTSDLQTAFQAIDSMAKTFQSNALEMKVAALTKCASVPQMIAQHKAIAKEAMTLVDQAVSQDNFTVVDQLDKLALAEAHKALDADLATEAQGQLIEVTELARAYEGVKTAQVALEKTPLDSAANLVVGKYLCFVKGDWDKGLSMLALGKDETLKALAKQENEGATLSTEQATLGDGWWGLAEKEEGTVKKQMQGRAVYWYRKALPGLTGLMEAKVEKRIRSSQQQVRTEDSAVLAKDQATEKKSDIAKKSLEAKKMEHTSWHVRTITSETVKEPIMENRIRYVGGGVAQTYQVPSGQYRHVQKKRPVYETLQGHLVSYQGSDVTIDVSGQGHRTFNYGNLSRPDCNFLQEYRKLEQK